ncbi:MAG: 30S ribosomal protein S3, partial [Nanoarchaeota archaeon]|nr:30S ribosomal protein S3 [Nanoarchaeota archaeon]
MIERKFVKDKLREFTVQEFITGLVPGAGHSKTKIKRTPLGDKVIVFAAKPGLVVGKKGENIRGLSSSLKSNFKLENPQVEISELDSPMLDARVVCERIVRSLERFGTARFKRIGHSTLEAVMNAGALGVEIHMSGRIPGSRAKSWRFFQGYIKKSGSTSQHDVDKAIQNAQLKSGVVGVQVKIMPPTIKLPDNIVLHGEEISETEMRVEAAKAGGAALPKVEGTVDEEDLGLVAEPTEELIEEEAETTEETKEKKPAKKKTSRSRKKET